eukprot:gene28057-33875_t
MANVELGITEFMDGSAPGIHGIIKERFSDFIVREIDLDGQVCYLQSIHDVNFIEVGLFGDTTVVTENPDASLSKYQAFMNALKESASAACEEMSAEALAELGKFVDLCVNKDKACPVEWVGLPSNDKAVRSAIHQAVKRELGAFMESDSLVKDGVTFIRLLPKHLLKNSHDNKRRRVDAWPKTCPDFLSFTLLKENVDTLHAISILAKHLRISTNSITFNGTKDKRGITAQKLTVYRKKPSDFKKINTYPHNPIMRVGDFAFTSQCARLGKLSGNQFELVLRGVDASDEDIKQACESLKKRGFVNYFGLQRFGKGGGGTHSMGVYILHSMWQECVDLLFVPKASDKEAIKQGKLLYKAGKFREASDILPEAMQAEKGVLRALASNSQDFKAALHTIPKHTRLMYVHAYQSYVWNLSASERLRRGGAGGGLMLGDLVCVHGAVSDKNETADKAADTEVDVDVEVDGGNDGSMTVKEITQDDLDKSTYNLTDLVLPLVGYDIVLPSNFMGEYIMSILRKDSLTLDSFRQGGGGAAGGMYRVRGAYRRVVGKVEEFSYNVVRYDGKADDIAKTELDLYRIGGKKSEGVVSEGVDCDAAEGKEPVVEGKYKALQIQFSLSSGCYATMVLRELTKESTETDYQATLSSGV